ncbi:MAG: GntR family transcriptional regulator [Anaerolineae bacterium]
MSENDTPHFETLNIVNLRDRIKDQICEAILHGMFGPGSRVIEASIAEQFGVSRAPVREALVALEREGIVKNLPRRGYSVIDFTDKDIDEIYSLRRLLEADALRRAVPRFDTAAIAELQHLVDQLGLAMRDKADVGAIIALDLGFHDNICRVADHQRLYDAWNSMRLQTWLLIGLTSRIQFDSPDQPQDIHQTILDAIKDGDAPRAEASLTEHLMGAEERAHLAWRMLRSEAERRAQSDGQAQIAP